MRLYRLRVQYCQRARYLHLEVVGMADVVPYSGGGSFTKYRDVAAVLLLASRGKTCANGCNKTGFEAKMHGYVQ